MDKEKNAHTSGFHAAFSEWYLLTFDGTLWRNRLRPQPDEKPPVAQEPATAERHHLHRTRPQPQLAVQVGRPRRLQHEPMRRPVPRRGPGRRDRNGRAHGQDTTDPGPTGPPVVHRLSFVRGVLDEPYVPPPPLFTSPAGVLGCPGATLTQASNKYPTGSAFQ